MSEQYFGVDSTCLECAILRAHILNLERELAEARAEIERLNSPVLKSEWQQMKSDLETERLRLAACGVAAMQNTPASIAERITRDNPYWSASYGDVCAAVDREMALRAEVEAAARWFWDAGRDSYNEDTFDAAWSRYQQEKP